MTRTTFAVALLLTALASAAAHSQAPHTVQPVQPAQPAPSPYVGQESRAIKALSADEVQGYLEGRGLGFAKAAELNRHPGPMHVLEMAGPLQLTPEQEAETQKAFERMRGEAKRLGESVVARETELDRLFAQGQADDDSVGAVVREIARLQGELRLAHLRAHLDMKRLLTPAQVTEYDRLRGYGGSAPHDGHGHHGHRRSGAE